VVAEELERLGEADEMPMVTVTSVEVAGDMRTAVVYLASLDDETTVLLEEQRGHLQHLISTQMTMKRTPRLSFEADPAIATGSRVEELLRRLREVETAEAEAEAEAEESRRPSGRESGDLEGAPQGEDP
jgi:ribosome-binding factor A